jgi:hypothetical protein
MLDCSLKTELNIDWQIAVGPGLFDLGSHCILLGGDLQCLPYFWWSIL